MRIACLHTVESNRAVFDAAAVGSGIELHHLVRDDLLKGAEQAGGLTEAIAGETEGLLRDLAGEAEGVLLTCSTLGPVAERLRVGVPVLRVDAALAERAVRDGGRVVALIAVATTWDATREIFEKAAAGSGASVEVRLVPEAWSLFRAGDLAGYHRLVAEAADAAFAEGAAVVALAQASMAGAAGLTRQGSPLTSPAAGLEAVQRAAAG